MNKIQFNININNFKNRINTCSNDKKKLCGDNYAKKYSPCVINDITNNSIYNNTEARNYNELLNKIITHFNYIITLNTETKKTFSNKINTDKLNKRYVFYDSLDLDYENSWLKKLTFWLYVVVILLYISVFVLKNLYNDKMEFLYLIIIIIIPFISERIIHIINYFYKFNILFTNN